MLARVAGCRTGEPGPAAPPALATWMISQVFAGGQSHHNRIFQSPAAGAGAAGSHCPASGLARLGCRPGPPEGSGSDPLPGALEIPMELASTRKCFHPSASGMRRQRSGTAGNPSSRPPAWASLEHAKRRKDRVRNARVQGAQVPLRRLGVCDSNPPSPQHGGALRISQERGRPIRSGRQKPRHPRRSEGPLPRGSIPGESEC